MDKCDFDQFARLVSKAMWQTDMCAFFDSLPRRRWSIIIDNGAAPAGIVACIEARLHDINGTVVATSRRVTLDGLGLCEILNWLADYAEKECCRESKRQRDDATSRLYEASILDEHDQWTAKSQVCNICGKSLEKERGQKDGGY
jgi:hypothetical protein